MDKNAETFLAEAASRFDDALGRAHSADVPRILFLLEHRLNRFWYGAKPGAFLPDQAFQDVNRRFAAVGSAIFAKKRALMAHWPKEEEVSVFDRIAPTPETFFHARHHSDTDGDQPAERLLARLADAESRLGFRLPQALAALYALQDGGHTEFDRAAAAPDPPYEFRGAACDHDHEVWPTVILGGGLAPLARLQTIGVHSDGVAFGEPGASWRETMPDVDALVALSSHGSEKWLCLDYRGGRAEPGVKLFDDATNRGGGMPCVYQAADFAAFFAGLRREGITERWGVKWRGARLIDDGGPI